MRDPASLVEHPRNYNTHPAEQIRLLAKIIRHQGWRNPITVSKRSGYVVKGHGRLAAALQLGCSEVPVDVQEYKDEASEYADMIADNRIAELAEADQDALKGLLTDDVFEGFDLDLTGFGDLDFLNEESQNEIDDLSEKIQEQWRIEVECKNENEAQILFEKFSEEGITCKILTL
jgi:ParB-like chromosome segregation protein Spo0J